MNRILLYSMNLFKSGWLVSMLALLPFIQNDYGLSLLDIGFLGMVVTVVSIFAAFFAGNVSDRIGNRGIILASIMCYILVWAGFWIGPSKEVLYIMYGLGGVSSGFFGSISTAIIAKGADKKRRGAEIGNYSAFGDVGRFALISVTTILMGWLSLSLAALLYLIIGIIFFCTAFISTKNISVVKSEKSIRGILNPWLYLRKPLYRHALFAGILDTFSSSSLYIFLPFLLSLKGISIASSGFFTALFFVGYFAGRLILGRIADRFGAARILIIGEICMAILIASLVFISSYVLIVINLFLLGIFTRGTAPVVKSMIADGLDESEFEKGYSLYSSATKTSNALSRPAYASLGNFLGIASIFYASATAALLTIIPAVRFYQSRKHK